jgi:phage-related protein
VFVLYEIIFYKDDKDDEPVYDHMKELAGRTDKDSRINLQKIQDYIKALRTYGIMAGEPYIKHLDGEIWEIRPLRNRILFAALPEDRFILLHCFIKKTQKTPRREIEQAKRELAIFKERAERDEQENRQ